MRLEILQEYDFDIIYHQGKENIIVDSLNCEIYLGTISMPDDPTLLKVRESALEDLDYQKMVDLTRTRGRTNVKRSPISNYLEDEGCLYYRHRLCIPRDATLRKLILSKAHNSLTLLEVET